MQQVLGEVFDKKSPILIITITSLICAAMSLSQPYDYQCPHSHTTHLFELVVVILSSLQVFFKVIGLQLCKKICQGSIVAIHRVTIGMFILLNLGLLGWGVVTLNRNMQECPGQQPHIFFIQVYCSVFGLVYLCVLGVILSVWLQNKSITVFQQNQEHKE